MKRHQRFPLLLLLTCALHGTAVAATFDAAALHSFADTRYHRFTSHRLERDFHVYLARMAHWNRRAERPWNLQTADLAGHTHFSAAPEAFRQGIGWLFSPD